MLHSIYTCKTNCNTKALPLGGDLRPETSCRISTSFLGIILPHFCCNTQLVTKLQNPILHQYGYLVIKNSMSLLLFSFILQELTNSSISCVISGRLLLLPPRLKLDDVEEELSPESGTGDAWHSRRKSQPPKHITKDQVFNSLPHLSSVYLGSPNGNI